MYSLVVTLVRWSLNLLLQRLICCCLCVSVSVASCFYVSVSAASCEVQDHLHHLVDTLTLHVVSLWLFSGRGGGLPLLVSVTCMSLVSLSLVCCPCRSPLLFRTCSTAMNTRSTLTFKLPSRVSCSYSYR